MILGHLAYSQVFQAYWYPGESTWYLYNFGTMEMCCVEAKLQPCRTRQNDAVDLMEWCLAALILGFAERVAVVIGC